MTFGLASWKIAFHFIRIAKHGVFMTISEVAKKFGMSEDALRYYEKIGIIPPVLRTSGGIRNYADDDIHWVEFAKRMRDAGVSTEALVEYVSLVFEGKKTVSRRKKILRD